MTKEEKHALETLRANDYDKEYVTRLMKEGQAIIVPCDTHAQFIDCEYLAGLINDALNKKKRTAKWTARDIISEQNDGYFFFDGGVVVLRVSLN